MERRELLSAIAGTTVAALAGCAGGGGGGGGGGGETTTESTTTTTTTTTGGGTTTTTTASGGGATVAVRDVDTYGEILVGPEGMSLYMFEKDTKGSGKSTCEGDCASAWPPLTVSGEPTAGAGVTASLSTFERSDGSTQVAANGWPLYYFVKDKQPGDTKGQGVNGFGAKWYLLAPDGTPIRGEAGGGTTTTTTTSGGGGGGY